jgi:hypothetical protein
MGFGAPAIGADRPRMDHRPEQTTAASKSDKIPTFVLQFHMFWIEFSHQKIVGF